MPRRLHQTLADYLVLAITPGLIMFMVGSLLQFLLGVCYQGNYPERLSFTLMDFVFAAVLIARISMTEGSEKAILYGAALAIVVALALDRYVDYGKTPIRFTWAINWSLMALVWWSAHKLTWDCTLMDDGEESMGEGLLQSAGLDRGVADAPEDAPMTPPEPEAVTDRNAAPQSWWQRFIERRRRPHAHGVWVIYFSLAALPLFGIGQLCLSAASLERRRHAFALLCVYVASGLGLLLTTSFLGLRRYLRQRGLEMPLAMANSWVAVGSALILGVLVFAALLPRPNPEYAISELPFQVGSPDQRASDHAIGKEGTPDERGGKGSTVQPKPDPKQYRDGSSGNESKEASQNGSQTDSQKGSEPQPKQPGDHGEQNGSQSGENGKRGEQNGKDGEQKRNQSTEKGKGSEGKQTGSQPAEKSKAGKAGSSQPSHAGSEKKSDSQTSRAQPPERNPSPGQRPPDSPPPAAAPPPALRSIGVGDWILLIFRWLFYGVVCGLAAWGLWRYRREVVEWLGEVVEQWRKFWQVLFGGRSRSRPEVAVDALPTGPAPKSFSEFADPFASGVAARWAAEDLVKYSFEALEAWGREQGCARQEQETPLEFARRLGAQGTTLLADAERLAGLYCQIAYAGATLPSQGTEQVRRFWRSLAQAAVSV